MAGDEVVIHHRFATVLLTAIAYNLIFRHTLSRVCSGIGSILPFSAETSNYIVWRLLKSLPYSVSRQESGFQSDLSLRISDCGLWEAGISQVSHLAKVKSSSRQTLIQLHLNN